MGRFATTRHRRVFLYALLDEVNYDRQCGNCGTTVRDITFHGLQECPRAERQREILELTMRLYNAPKELNLRCKAQLLK